MAATPDWTPIAVRVTATGLPSHDPLDLYAGLRRTLPEQEVFLFESVAGPADDLRTATVGHGRLAELRVFDGYVDIDGLPALATVLLRAAPGLGLTPAARAPAPGTVRLFFDHPDRLWRLLALAREVFRVDTELPDTGYAFGFLATFAYESCWLMETLPPRTKAPRGPDVTLTLFRDVVRYDLVTGLVHHLRAEGAELPPPAARPDVAALARTAAADRLRPAGVPRAPAPLAVRDSVDRETFLAWAERCLEHIRVGDVYQIQIGHRIDVETALTPVEVYRRLRDRNPSPYMYLMPRADRMLIGASPELFLRIEGDDITMRPIAGTTRRGPDETENRQRIKEMRESVKEQAEHIMLVDLCRNDLGRVCRPSTRPVERLMAVESFSHVFHLVSTVSGSLAEGTDVWQAVRATFPAGTMSGAPKKRATEIIDSLEREPRGSYAGAVGLVDVRGWSELALCIRTIEYDGSVYSSQSSAGMVAQSRPEAEWQETLAKLAAAYWALTGEELTA
ncbi:anthranilate synthase component I family protein [Kitasatospora sp. NPDC097605]|uniref:anthranilate synthase component I family protein n=1 Tax=Kitasatospora sp. NPDC097605 TaxID=3157226 RepID=UPI00332DB1AA